jgi:5-(carboxyamino)imidazole ribonucleotide synthase
VEKMIMRFPFKTRIGILGGGQLGRMLAEAVARFGFEPVVYSSDAKASAGKICPNLVLGNLDDVERLALFFQQVELVIYENEFIPYDVVKEAFLKSKTHFLPSLETIHLFQEKIKQKELLKKLQIPTASYTVWEDGDAGSWVSKVLEEFQGSCILKWSRLGYDGKGVFHLNPQSKEKAVAFCQQAKEKKVLVYAETFLDFEAELAILACYSTAKAFSTYPLVFTQQENHVCKTVWGPAVTLGIPLELEEKAKAYAKKIAEASQLFGVFAIEFFKTKNGELWVNEIAPRVHNTGHYTLDAAATNQFENHVRAVLGMPLGNTQTTPIFAMQNLLGPPEVSCLEEEVSPPFPLPSMHLYWYGKENVLPWRKLGHLNAVGTNPSEVEKILEDLKRVDEAWMAQVRTTKGVVFS